MSIITKRIPHHGPVWGGPVHDLGLIFSLPMAFGAMLGPENPEFNYTMLFVSTIVNDKTSGIDAVGGLGK